MEQPRNEAVTKIEWEHGKWRQSLLAENLTFYEGLSMVVDLRGFMQRLMKSDIAPQHRTYYRLGRPH